jgi:hypothetical protein
MSFHFLVQHAVATVEQYRFDSSLSAPTDTTVLAGSVKELSPASLKNFGSAQPSLLGLCPRAYHD